MNEITLVVGAIAALVILVILVKFGKVIINTLALAGLLGLLGLGAFVYLRATGGQAVTIPQAAHVVQQVAPAATAEPEPTPKPSGWLGKATGALADVAAVARVLKPEQKQEPAAVIPTPVVVRVPQASSSGGVLGTFCAGAFAMVAVAALGVAGVMYWQRRRPDAGPGLGALFERRWGAGQQIEQRPALYYNDAPRPETPNYDDDGYYYIDDDDDNNILGGDIWADAWDF